MQDSMGSPNISRPSEATRKFSAVEPGDIISVKKFTHRWGEPKPEDPNAPWIREGSIPMEANKGHRFCLIYVGSHPEDEPYTHEEIEESLNKLGWFRRDNG